MSKSYKKCLEDNCNKFPTFNFSGETNYLYCNEHKKFGMINIKDKRCLENDCNKQANINFFGETKS